MERINLLNSSINVKCQVVRKEKRERDRLSHHFYSDNSIKVSTIFFFDIDCLYISITNADN